MAVEGGDTAIVAAIAAEDLAVPVAEGEKYELRYEFDDLRAPVRAGERIGRAILEIEGQVADECDLIAAEGVEKFSLRSALRKILRRWAIVLSA